MALLAFQGRLLAGVGKALRIYDCGKRKLLRKCETKVTRTLAIHLFDRGYDVAVFLLY